MKELNTFEKFAVNSLKEHVRENYKTLSVDGVVDWEKAVKSCVERYRLTLSCTAKEVLNKHGEDVCIEVEAEKEKEDQDAYWDSLTDQHDYEDEAHLSYHERRGGFAGIYF